MTVFSPSVDIYFNKQESLCVRHNFTLLNPEYSCYCTMPVIILSRTCGGLMDTVGLLDTVGLKIDINARWQYCHFIWAKYSVSVLIINKRRHVSILFDSFFFNSFGHSKLINKKVRHKYYNIIIFYKLRNGQLSPLDCFVWNTWNTC